MRLVATELILVNGLPGSGKSTLAAGLSAALRAQLLSKDAIKEALAAILNDPMTVGSLGAIAMDAAWSLAAALPGTVVLESWWFRPRDVRFAADGLRSVGADAVIEVWCDVPAALAQARYARRDRAAVYEDARHLAAEWPDWAAGAKPLALSPVLRVDTRTPVDYPGLAAALIDRLQTPT